MAEALKAPLPVITLALIVAGIAVYVMPGAYDALIYDRTAVVRGEAWRLFTGSFVHFTPKHLILNLIALAVTGPAIERHGHGRFLIICLSTVLLSGGVLLVYERRIMWYGGLSGVAHASAFYMTLHGSFGNGGEQRLFRIAMLLILAKVSYEIIFGGSLWFPASQLTFITVPSIHMTGLLCALATYAVCEATGLRRRADENEPPRGKLHGI